MGQRILGADCADGWWGFGLFDGGVWRWGWNGWGNGFWERIARMVGGGLGCLMGVSGGGVGADGSADSGNGLRGWLVGFWLFDGSADSGSGLRGWLVGVWVV